MFTLPFSRGKSYTIACKQRQWSVTFNRSTGIPGDCNRLTWAFWIFLISERVGNHLSLRKCIGFHYYLAIIEKFYFNLIMYCEFSHLAGALNHLVEPRKDFWSEFKVHFPRLLPVFASFRTWFRVRFRAVWKYPKTFVQYLNGNPAVSQLYSSPEPFQDPEPCGFSPV